MDVVIVNGPTRRHRRLALALLTVLIAACAGTSTEPPAGTRPTAAETPSAPTPSAITTTASNEPTSSQSTTQEPDIVTAIRITVADQTITAQLADNPTAQDLAAQLPLTVSIRDFNRVEKIADLPRPLTMDGVPAGDDPDINDIGYYAPSSNLVFYYGDVGYFTGIVRIGRFGDEDIDLIQRQPDGSRITIERA